MLRATAVVCITINMELFKYIGGEKGYDDFKVFTKHISTLQIDPTEESFDLWDNQLYKSWKELGNAPIIGGYLDLGSASIETLDGLESVGSWLNLYNTPIKSLGNLKSVGVNLNLSHTPNLKSLGKLDHVGGVIFVTEGSTTEELVKNSKFAGKIGY